MATALNNKGIITLANNKRTEDTRVKIIDALVEYFLEHKKNGRKLFALTITYTKEINDNSKINFLLTIQHRFHHWFWDKLLPDEIFCSKKWLERTKTLQPYIFIFTEQHEPKSVNADRLHHHAILAVSPETELKFMHLMNRHNLSDLCKGVMTVKFKNADTGWIDYCMKDFCKNNYELNFYGPTSS